MTILFDADNTLYRTKGIAKESDMEALKIVESLTRESVDELYKKFIEIVGKIKTSKDPKIRHRKYSYTELIKKLGIDDEYIVTKMLNAFENNVIKSIEPMPEIQEILAKLYGDGHKLIVTTEDDKNRTKKKLEALNLLNFFSQIISSDDTGAMKPSIKYYESLLKETSPENIIAVGDSEEKDLSIPKKLGMKTLLIKSHKDLVRVLSLVKA